MKPFQLCGLGNAIVDLFVEMNDQDFAECAFERGTMRLVDFAEQKKLLERFSASDPRLVSGGSVANSIIGFAQLGGRAAYIGCVGDDQYGLHYQNELSQFGVGLGHPVVVYQPTGTCCAIITPDAERTMRTCLGVASHLSGSHVKVDQRLIADSEMLFIEGYLFSNNEPGQEAVREAVAVAKANKTKIAVTCSDAFIVHVFGKALHETLASADIFFCNAAEACAAANATDSQEAFQKLKSMVPNCVVTDGPAGAYIRWNGEECHVPAFPCTPKDLTGAGDMFAGAFLYGVLNGYKPELAARGANFLAMQVITQLGARLDHSVRDGWNANTV